MINAIPQYGTNAECHMKMRSVGMPLTAKSQIAGISFPPPSIKKLKMKTAE